jgi:hypothetical protein
MRIARAFAQRLLKIDPLLLVAQTVIAAAAIAGAYFHALPIQHSAQHENYPVVDAVTIGWIGLLVIAFVLPRITELSLGGTSLKLRQVKESSADIVDSLGAVANLAQSWSTSVAIYVGHMAKATNSLERDGLFANYLRDRMSDARGFLSEDPDDNVRIALWLYDLATQNIEFVYSNEFEPTKKSYAKGEGLLGQAFSDPRRYITDDVRTEAAYKSTRKGDPPYRGAMCHPVIVGNSTIGILTADKRSVGLFSNLADEIGRGLAAQCALAVDQRSKYP